MLAFTTDGVFLINKKKPLSEKRINFLNDPFVNRNLKRE